MSDEKQVGVDYLVVYEYTCMNCRHSWRLTFKPNQISCPKCRSMKLYYVSKRSCDEVSEEVVIPETSEMLL